MAVVILIEVLTEKYVNYDKGNKDHYNLCIMEILCVHLAGKICGSLARGAF